VLGYPIYGLMRLLRPTLNGHTPGTFGECVCKSHGGPVQHAHIHATTAVQRLPGAKCATGPTTRDRDAYAAATSSRRRDAVSDGITKRCTIDSRPSRPPPIHFGSGMWSRAQNLVSSASGRKPDLVFTARAP